jgi:hypothetical protein
MMAPQDGLLGGVGRPLWTIMTISGTIGLRPMDILMEVDNGS